MKKWVQKLIDQLDLNIHIESENKPLDEHSINEEKGTLLYILDILNKHLIETDNYPARKTRETLDDFTKGLIQKNDVEIEQLLFRFRQFYSKYRIDECAYIEKTFEDFKSIVWDFADQLSDDVLFETKSNMIINDKLSKLRDAVDSNSIQDLKNQSREFIDTFIEYQSKKDNRNNKKVAFIENSLNSIKRKLSEANQHMRRDHLTNAFNRKSYDENIKLVWSTFQSDHKPASLILLDIDHFKKINDNFGHDTGDFIIIECVKLMQSHFSRENDFVARIGGEEFAVILPGLKIEHAADKAQKVIEKIRKEVFVKDNQKLSFTVSMGVSQLGPNESLDQWIKRTDEALYNSKNNGRNQFTLAKYSDQTFRVA